ncbi:nitroreductase [Chelativorans sp. Marseille-P2723]|uniref:nitroreductase family protein n=1 Tax=Chelativorans sp. Marseille-P2723 TaxID=2709133 RepID=UPI00156E1820|nr:nitroreductase [Chelativorans sp. Marseille-P2723]
MSASAIDLLLARRSPPIHELKPPAPSEEELNLILRAATRVPDHGMLTPWRFIVYRGEAREKVGQMLAELAEKREGPLPKARREQELTRFSRAPLVIGVVSHPKESRKIPQWEMFVSGAMAAMNLITAANALGYRTNMITNWYSDAEEGRRILGLAPQERVIGFIHIGSFTGEVPDRPRPDAASLVSDYKGPWENSEGSSEADV